MSDELEKADLKPDPEQTQPQGEQAEAELKTDPEQPPTAEASESADVPATQEQTPQANVESASDESQPSTPDEPSTPPDAPPQAGTESASKAASFLERQRLRAASAEPVPSLQQETETNDAPSMDVLDDDIESEIEAAMSGMSDKEMYGDSTPRQRDKKEGGRSKGHVISIHGQDVFVDVPGSRSQGVLSMTQFPDGPPEIGAEVEVSIEKYDQENGLLILSRRGEAVSVDWSSVATGQVVEARVTGTNKGGLTVEVNGIRGFMPVSQIDLYRVENVEQFVNQRLKCMVTEVNPQERNLVVSRRALLEQEREQQREKLWEELQVGETREGVVRSVRNFGAFVDLGGIDGLLHVSEMSWGHVDDPGDVVKPGQAVKVKVLKLDPAKRKISLGLKQLAASPWDSVEENYPINSVASGKVTRIMNFGAFVELEPGVEGLIHISELGDHRVNRVSDVVQVSQELDVMVLRVDRQQQRIGLSLRAAQSGEIEEQDQEEQVVEQRQRPASKTPLRGGIGD